MSFNRKDRYLLRRINGRYSPWIQYMYSPEFVIGNRGEFHIHDAVLKTTPDEMLWLLSCDLSQTNVAYQPQSRHQLLLRIINGKIRNST